MNIEVITPPKQRSSGRRPRLSAEAIKDLASAIEGGEWATDKEPTKTRSTAYQRAQAAVKALNESFGLEAKTTTFQADESDPNSGWVWAIGPRPEGETRRRKATDEADES